MQTSRPGSVREAERNDKQLLSFEFDNVRRQRVRHHEAFRKLIGETRVPEPGHELRRSLLFHHANCTWHCDEPCLGETIEKDACSKEVIAMPMSGINGWERFSRGGDPIGLRQSLILGNEGVDEDSIPSAKDESRGNRRPTSLVLSRRKVGAHNRDSGSYKCFPIQLCIAHVAAPISGVCC